MEEWVGKLWHNWVTGAAGQSYPEAAVTLAEMQASVGVMFRAMGGDGGLQIDASMATAHGSRRSMLQRVAGTGERIELAWRDQDVLRLPARIDCFPTVSLNRGLYLWLAALAAYDQARYPDWFPHNQALTTRVLDALPGMRNLYRRLVEAHLQQRPEPASLPPDEARREQVIRDALQQPQQQHVLPLARRRPAPVPLWLHPAPPVNRAERQPANTDATGEREQADQAIEDESHVRRSAERVDEPDGKSGLLAFRLESIFSWSEFARVDRTSDDADDDDPLSVVRDLETVTVARGEQTGKSRLKLDLDLPSAEFDDLCLEDGILLPEWDYRRQTLQPDHCSLRIMQSRDDKSGELPRHLRPVARKLRRQFEALKPGKQWHRRQPDGSDIDVDAYLQLRSDQMQGKLNGEQGLFLECRQSQRDLACLLLADLSLSTDAWINNDARVIDVIQDALYLFGEALDASHDRYSICGFSSRNRNHIRFNLLKRFDESYGEPVRQRIASAHPGYYTRMGAAIRQATRMLTEQPNEQKLLLLLTDGKPNDLDKYEGRYGIEDTRMALIEAEKAGLRPFCVTIDEKAKDYLPYVFGRRSYIVIKNASELPHKLPQLYARLTGST